MSDFKTTCHLCDATGAVPCPHCDDSGCDKCADAVDWAHQLEEIPNGHIECPECDGAGATTADAWAAKYQDWHWNVARSVREKGEEAQPIAFVVAGEGVLPIARVGVPSERWARAIRAGISGVGGELVLLVTEGWIPKAGLEELGLAVKLAGGHVRDIAHDEVLLCTAETEWGTTRTLRARISDGELGETEDSGWVPVSESAGTLTGFWDH